MKKLCSVILIFIFVVFQVNAEKPKPMSKRWNLLTKLIDDEIKTINSLKNLGPQLRYRIIELESEKIKLIKEKENLLFLSAHHLKRKKIGKKGFFKASQQLYQKTMKEGLVLAKKFPRFDKMPYLYYTLALNSRDYGGDKHTRNFLLKSLKYSRNKPAVSHNARVTLAEYHYNAKEYKLAVYYYNKVLKNKTDEWRTKHLFNVGWCHLKRKKFTKAINSLKEAYFLGKENKSGIKYVIMEDQVLDSIATFYVHGRKIEDGAKFFIENLKEPVSPLLAMARKTANKGLFKKTRFLLTKSHELAKNNQKMKTQILLAELPIYKNFQRLDFYFKVVKKLDVIHTLNPLKKDDAEVVVGQVSQLVGYLQLRLSKNLKVNVRDYSEQDLQRIIDYYSILTHFDSQKSHIYYFYQAETYYSVGEYKRSSPTYMKALEFSKTLKDKTEVKIVQKKILNSLLASISLGEFNKANYFKYTDYTYTNYITYWPKDEKSREIYKKLFNLYFEYNKISQAIPVIDLYVSAYLKDIDFQRGMTSRIFDYHVKKKEPEKLALWIKKLSNGYLKFEKKYIEKATNILGGILFEEYQVQDNSGQNDKAIEGYQELYSAKQYPNKIKAKAAFNASKLYLENKETAKSYDWLKNSLRLWPKSKNPKIAHPQDEIFNSRKQIMLMVDYYHYYDDFETAAKLSKLFLKSYCQVSYSTKEDFFRKAVHFKLIEKNYKSAFSLLQLGENCNVSKKLLTKTKKQMAIFSLDINDYEFYFDTFEKYNKIAGLSDFYKDSNQKLYWHARYTDDSSLKNDVKKIIKKFDFIEYKIISSFENVEKQYHKFLKSDFTQDDIFNQENFNKELNGQLNLVKKLAEKTETFLKYKKPDFSIGSYYMLSNIYSSLNFRIRSFSPNGMPKEFVQGFKKFMKGLGRKLEKKALAYSTAGSKTIKRSMSFTQFNHQLIWDKPQERLGSWRYPAGLRATSMDLTQVKRIEKQGGRK
jgi:hypothetical protein